jgi:hypothetical protein
MCHDFQHAPNGTGSTVTPPPSPAAAAMDRLQLEGLVARAC